MKQKTLRCQSCRDVTSRRGRCNNEIVCARMIILKSQRNDWVDGDDEVDAHDDLVDDAMSVDAMQEDTDYAGPIQPRHRKYCPMQVKRW